MAQYRKPQMPWDIEQPMHGVRSFAAHAYGLLSAVLLWSWISNVWDWAPFCGAVMCVFTLAALWTCSVAIARQDRVARGALNAWDEAAALAAVAAAARLVMDLHR